MENDTVTAIPNRAYDLLDFDEREIVDGYLIYVQAEAARLGERIANALQRPIPSDMIRRSKGILNRPLVRAALSEVIHKASDEQDLSPHRLIKEIGALAHSNMDDYLTRGEFGAVEIDLGKCTRAQMSALKTFRIVPTIYGNRYEITLYDKQPSQRMLAEMMGLINNNSGDTPIPPLLGKADRQPKAIGGNSSNSEKDYAELLSDLSPNMA